ncbi:hypothetical protein L204_101877 [Cryptococcus depauperatus]|nr:2,4-dienoyl-CoA reductase [Cryptococcus depauperatus CBS 7855]
MSKSTADKISTALKLRDHLLDNARHQAQEIKKGSERLRGRVGIITGVGPELGIGTAAAKLFAREGTAHLYLLDFGDKQIESLLDYLKENYPETKVDFVKADAADAGAISSLIDRAIKDEGRFDFYFANAGTAQAEKASSGKNGNFMSFAKPIENIGEDEFSEVMRVNALGGFIAIKYASAAMSITCPEKGKTVPGGSIVLTSSVAGLKANGGPIPYSASKAATVSMAQSAAFAFAGTNIRVNAICPGLIETDMTKFLFNLAKATGTEHKIGTLNPTLRQGVGHEVAQTVLFLVSDDSLYVNGQAIPVDGGLSAGLPYVQSNM